MRSSKSCYCRVVDLDWGERMVMYLGLDLGLRSPNWGGDGVWLGYFGGGEVLICQYEFDNAVINSLYCII